MRYLLCFLFFMQMMWAEDCPTMLRTPQEAKALAEMRVKLIKGWDKIVTWALKPQNPPYLITSPPHTKTFQPDAPSLREFNENYGYFSVYHPIVGVVTEDERDIHVTQCLLDSTGQEIHDRTMLQFATEEILAKVLSYRSLKKGMKISISLSKSIKHTFIVDEEIDLWRGMPAYGLMPERKNGVAPILLFRGTDLDLTSEKGWASVLSDLDTTGPGHSTFLRARREIHNWLKKAQKQHEKPRAIGYSLGGVFVYYTMIYEGDLLNTSDKSVAFNPPGISKELLEKWEQLETKPPHIAYINQGDFVSQIGFLLPNVSVLSLQKSMRAIQAHVTLLSGQPKFFEKTVDVEEENNRRE